MKLKHKIHRWKFQLKQSFRYGILSWKYWFRKCGNLHDRITQPREYLVAYSGHGSDDRFELEDVKVFERLVRERKGLLTHRQAEQALDHWIGYACTIGGSGEVINAVDYVEQTNNWRETFPWVKRQKNERVAC